MNKLLTAVVVVMAASVASAGVFERVGKELDRGVEKVVGGAKHVGSKFSAPGANMTWEQIHKNPSLYVVGKQSVGSNGVLLDDNGIVGGTNGIGIFNACDNGQGEVVTINKVSYCEGGYADVIAEDDQKYELFPRTVKKCIFWGKAHKVAKLEKEVCANWVLELANDGDGNGDEYQSVCEKDENGDAIMTTVPVSTTFAVEVARDIDSDGAKPFLDDNDQIAFVKDYTIPACPSEVVPPVPDKKK